MTATTTEPMEVTIEEFFASQPAGQIAGNRPSQARVAHHDPANPPSQHAGKQAAPRRLDFRQFRHGGERDRKALFCEAIIRAGGRQARRRGPTFETIAGR